MYLQQTDQEGHIKASRLHCRLLCTAESISSCCEMPAALAAVLAE